MKTGTAVLVLSLLFAGPALAQAPQQPAAPAQPAPASAQSPAAPPAAPTPPGEEKIDPEKQAAIVRLLQVTQESKLGDGVSEFVTTRVRSAMSRAIQPDRLPKFMDSFNQKFAASNVTSSVTDATVKVYARSFSLEDIRGLIQFYESPLGQRAVKALPDAQRQAESAGLEIGRQAAVVALNAMSADYPEVKALLQPSAPATRPGAAPGPAATPAPTPAPSQPAPQTPAAQPPQQ